MTFLSSTVSNMCGYLGTSDVIFLRGKNNELSVNIFTERLYMRSVKPSEEDYQCYVSLFSDQEIMSKYNDGRVRTKKEIQDRIKDIWAKRWNSNDPYSGLAIFKNDTHEFLGHVLIGHGEEAGQAELAYLFLKNHWNKGFGSEAINAVMKEYVPATIKEGYTLRGKPLKTITATVRPDNLASVKILEKVGMHKVQEKNKYGSLRYCFSVEVDQLLKKSIKV